jgi:hypothetical protein
MAAHGQCAHTHPAHTHPARPPRPADDISNPSKLSPEQVPIQELYNLKVTQLAFMVACMYTGVGGPRPAGAPCTRLASGV